MSTTIQRRGPRRPPKAREESVAESHLASVASAITEAQKAHLAWKEAEDNLSRAKASVAQAEAQKAKINADLAKYDEQKAIKLLGESDSRLRYRKARLAEIEHLPDGKWELFPAAVKVAQDALQELVDELNRRCRWHLVDQVETLLGIIEERDDVSAIVRKSPKFREFKRERHSFTSEELADPEKWWLTELGRTKNELARLTPEVLDSSDLFARHDLDEIEDEPVTAAAQESPTPRDTRSLGLRETGLVFKEQTRVDNALFHPGYSPGLNELDPNQISSLRQAGRLVTAEQYRSIAEKEARALTIGRN